MQPSASDDEKLQQALENCAQEPIHIPGTIQPHGYLLVLDHAFNIQRISANFIKQLELTIDAVLGSPLDTLISEHTIAELKLLISDGELNPLRYREIDMTMAGVPHRYDAILHKSGEMILLELESSAPAERSPAHQDFYQTAMKFSIDLQKTQDQIGLFDLVVTEVRQLTQFARVMLYQFDEHWNGDVVAESKDEHMDSYLGLSFPASDIPRQARELYSVNYLRVIADIDAQNSAIVPNDKHDDGTPIDLSFSSLRSVSPVHVEYLRNMNVKSSMSISVMQDRRLWGMIVCHHDKAHRPAYPVRMAAEMLAHTYSAYLSNYTQLQSKTLESEKARLLEEFRFAISPDQSLLQLLESQHLSMLSLLDADGIVVNLNNQFHAYGLVPEKEQLSILTEWLETNGEGQIFNSSAITRDTGLSIAGHEKICGAIITPIASRMHNYIGLFRKEMSMERQWAGEPVKNLAETKTGYHLSPRASFERWQEFVSGYSLSWSEGDIELARTVGKMLMDKTYQDSLRQITLNLNAVVDNSNALIYITDAQGHVMQINSTALKTFNLEESSVIGRPLLDVLPGSVAETVTAHIQRVFTENQSLKFDDNFVVDDKEMHFVTVNFPLHDAGQNVYAVCSISTDVSELHGIQQKLTTSNKELEQMAFVASHDLQEPIRMISTFTKLLKMDYGEKLDDQAEEYIKYTLNAADRMRVLIHDLLEYSRLGHVDIETPIIDSHKELEFLIDEMTMTEKLGNAQISITPPLPEIGMKTEHFICVMQNLVNNALKYAHPKRTARVSIACKDADPFWEFSVKDNGIGIKPEYLEKIFVIFQRLHKKSEFEGTGIGLSLCMRIAQRHGGTAWAESTPDVGSTFYFSIRKGQNTAPDTYPAQTDSTMSETNSPKKAPSSATT